jgi:pSer/pThr/pTyr-binding forkhead associated (FHA) protein
MPESLLQILKVCLLAVMFLFFLRVLRVVWTEIKPPASTPAPVPAAAAAARASGAATSSTAASAPAGRDGLRLRIVEPPERRGTVYELADEMTVGRAAGCGVALEDVTVSQLHARVFRRDGRLWVEDLGSTNGTFVNRKKVTAPVAMRRGDRLQIGSTVLEVGR